MMVLKKNIESREWCIAPLRGIDVVPGGHHADTGGWEAGEGKKKSLLTS